MKVYKVVDSNGKVVFESVNEYDAYDVLSVLTSNAVIHHTSDTYEVKVVDKK